jgi:hypothetical protein
MHDPSANPLADDLELILAHTRDLWDELRGQRIFITGGTGFFGCWLLESFAWANDKMNLNAKALVLTISAIGFEIGMMGVFVMPWFITLAWLHRREYVHHARMITTFENWTRRFCWNGPMAGGERFCLWSKRKPEAAVFLSIVWPVIAWIWRN